MSQQIGNFDIAKRDVISPAMRQAFDAAIVDKTMRFEVESGFALQILQGNDYLSKVAAGNLTSLRNAITNVAAIGISLNPARKQAYLVPRKGAVCLDVSYMGLMDLATETGSIKWGQANIVRELDTFELVSVDEKPRHTFKPFATDRGAIVGVYVVVKTADGDYLTHTMAIADVYAIRDRSEAWKAYKSDNGKKCPWVTDEAEMIKKTCVKQASKYWPSNPRLESAIHYMNTDGGEGIERDMGPVEVAIDTVDVAAALSEIDKSNDVDSLRECRKKWNAVCTDARNTEAWAMIKGATEVRARELQS